MDQPPSSPFPKKILPRDDRETAPIEEVVEAKRLGETTIDAIAKAQVSAPQVVKRMVELEECLWSLADLLSRLPPDLRESSGANAAIERAKTLLRQSLVMDHNSELDVPAEQPSRSDDRLIVLDLQQRLRKPE
jgi:hypothetical protein